jgi:hypothetical protein
MDPLPEMEASDWLPERRRSVPGEEMVAFAATGK